MHIVIDKYPTMQDNKRMNIVERELFDNGFFLGVEESKILEMVTVPGHFPKDPFNIGYLLGVIYVNEKKEIESSDQAWSEVN